MKRIFSFLTLLILPLFIFSQSGSQGPNSPSVATGDSWITPDYGRISDNNYASTTVGQLLESGPITFTGFGFNIPLTSVITGIKIEIERFSSPAGLKDKYLYLVLNGVSHGNSSSGTSWLGTEEVVTYGSETDTWDAYLTPAQINSPTFGVEMAVENTGWSWKSPMIDAVSVTVYYGDPPPPLGVALSIDGSGPEPCAMFEIKSGDRGFLPPRMDSDHMNQIYNPVGGLIIFNYDDNLHYYYNGSQWLPVESSDLQAGKANAVLNEKINQQQQIIENLQKQINDLSEKLNKLSR